jgi:hypothetical protein
MYMRFIDRVKHYIQPSRNIALPRKAREKRPIPIYLFAYHKSGTKLLEKVFYEISLRNGWGFRSLMGKQYHIPDGYDVLLFGHSLVDPSCLTQPFVGVHFVRDPRDIIVSGYLYHRRTKEKWCINTDLSTKAPIKFPRVPFSQEHRSEDWKIEYLESLDNKSYQANLLDMNQRDGLLFEINHYGGWTVENMVDWDYGNSNILEVKFEDMMKNYDQTFQNIFSHIGLSPSQHAIARDIAAKHDLGRKSEKEINNMKHVSSRESSKWQEYFEDVHKQVFQDKFGDILVRLNYENNSNW